MMAAFALRLDGGRPRRHLHILELQSLGYIEEQALNEAGVVPVDAAFDSPHAGQIGFEIRQAWRLAERLGWPSASCGTPGVGYFSHCAGASAASSSAPQRLETVHSLRAIRARLVAFSGGDVSMTAP